MDSYSVPPSLVLNSSQPQSSLRSTPVLKFPTGVFKFPPFYQVDGETFQVKATTMSSFRAVDMPAESAPGGNAAPSTPEPSRPPQEVGIPAAHPKGYWLEQIDDYVRRHCGEDGLPSHIDAEQVYRTLGRSQDFSKIDRSGPSPVKVDKQASDHVMWKEYRNAQTALLGWMAGKSHWKDNFTPIPAFGGPENVIAIIILANREGMFPKAWEARWEAMKLQHIIREIGSTAVHPFWKGARFESASWMKKFTTPWVSRFGPGTLPQIHKWIRKGPFVPEPSEAAWEKVTYLDDQVMTIEFPEEPNERPSGAGGTDTDNTPMLDTPVPGTPMVGTPLDTPATTNRRPGKPFDSQITIISRGTPRGTTASRSPIPLRSLDTPGNQAPDEAMIDTPDEQLQSPHAAVVEPEQPEPDMVTPTYRPTLKRARAGSLESIRPPTKKPKAGISSAPDNADTEEVVVPADEPEDKKRIMVTHLKYLQKYEVLDIIELFDNFNEHPAILWETQVDRALIQHCATHGPKEEDGTPRRYQWNLILNLVRGMLKNTGHLGGDGKLVKGHVPELKAEYVWPTY